MVLDELVSFAVSFNLWINAFSSPIIDSSGLSCAYEILLSWLYCSAPLQVPSMSLSTFPSLSSSHCSVSIVGGNNAFNSWKNLIILACLVSPVGSSSNIFVSKYSLARSTSTIDDDCSNVMNWLTFKGLLSLNIYSVISKPSV